MSRGEVRVQTEDLAHLDGAEREHYEQDGYLLRERVFDEAEIAAIIEAVERVCRDVVSRPDRSAAKERVSSFSVFEKFAGASVVIKWEPADPDRLKGLEPVAHLDAELAKLARHPGLVAPMRDLVGCDDVALFTEKLNLKRAGGGGGFSPHRDFPYWEHPAEEPERLVTAWIALDDADANNGALEVVPGSHRLGALPRKQSEKRFETFEIDTTRFAMDGLVSVPAAAGSVIFFGPHLVHSSAANRSQRDRRALLYTYQPAGLRTQLENTRRWFAQDD